MESNEQASAVVSCTLAETLPVYYAHPEKKLIEHAPPGEVCAACWEHLEVEGQKLCAACDRPMHGRCGTNVDDDLLCVDCLEGCFRCAICQSVGTVLLQPCSYFTSGCRSFLHPDCAKTDNGKDASCPLHSCLTCSAKGRNFLVAKGEMVSCVQCKASYHACDYCIPADAVMLSRKYFRCGEHYQTKKSHKKCSQPVNFNVCLLCDDGGDLLCCEKCPAAYHLECLLDEDETTQLPLGTDESFYCTSCTDGHKLLHGDVVWVKYGVYRWWPAQICHPKDVPNNVEVMAHYYGEFVVKFYGENLYAWESAKRVLPFLLYRVDQDESRAPNDRAALSAANDASAQIRPGRAASSSFDRATLRKKFAKAMLEAPIAAINREADLRLFELYEKGLDASKPHSESYVLIKRNEPVGNVKMALKPSRVSPDLREYCDCTAADAAPCSDSSCLNFSARIECHGKICNAGKACKNRRFRKRQNAPAYSFLTENKGYGLKAKRNITKGAFISEYLGELIDAAEYEKRVDAKAKSRVKQHYYFLTLDKDRIIDAERKGNQSRFLNHSCSPNCATEKWQVYGDVRIGLFATRDILKDEELTFNYQFDRFRKDCLVMCAWQQCFCKAEGCVGIIGPKNAATSKLLAEISMQSSPSLLREAINRGSAQKRRAAPSTSAGGKSVLASSKRPRKKTPAAAVSLAIHDSSAEASIGENSSPELHQADAESVPKNCAESDCDEPGEYAGGYCGVHYVKYYAVLIDDEHDGSDYRRE